MDRYVEGSTRAKVWYFIVCLAVALALVLVNVLFPVPQKPWTQVSQVQATAQRYLAGALLFAVLLVPWSFRIVALARLSIRHGRWPPPGIPMPFRTRVFSIAHPTVVYILVAMLLGIPLLVVATEFYAWYKLSQIAQSLVHATQPRVRERTRRSAARVGFLPMAARRSTRTLGSHERGLVRRRTLHSLHARRECRRVCEIRDREATSWLHGGGPSRVGRLPSQECRRTYVHCSDRASRPETYPTDRRPQANREAQAR